MKGLMEGGRYDGKRENKLDSSHAIQFVLNWISICFPRPL